MRLILLSAIIRLSAIMDYSSDKGDNKKDTCNNNNFIGRQHENFKTSNKKNHQKSYDCLMTVSGPAMMQNQCIPAWCGIRHLHDLIRGVSRPMQLMQMHLSNGIRLIDACASSLNVGSLNIVNRTMVCHQREYYALELRLTFSRTCSEQSVSQHYATVLNV